MVIVAVVLAIILNSIAAQIFGMIERNVVEEFGTIQAHQIQPDMPNLMASPIFYGWAFFLASFVVGRLSLESKGAC